jgi:hypothetical protein
MATATKKAPVKKTRVTKQQVTAHRTRGPRDGSPDWEGAIDWPSEQITRNFSRAMDYYRLESSVKDLRGRVVEWMQANDYDKAGIEAFRRLKDRHINSTLCGVAACLVKGMPPIHPGFNNGKDTVVWITGAIADAIRCGANDVDEPEIVEAKPEVKKETIQDRLTQKLEETIGDIEGAVDDYILQKKAFDAFKFLQASNLAANFATRVGDAFVSRIQELEEYLKGECDQLNDGYKHLGKKGAKDMIKFYQSIIDGANAYKAAKIATRAKPKRKPVPPEKVVRKLNYLKQFEELKLTSIDPRDILGCSELWIYNTKTRKLGRYLAATHGDMVISPLGVKNSNITGFDEIKSTAKTLRKPAEKLAEFKTQGKPGLRKFMDTIKSVETRLRPRISPDTILLRAVK